MKYGQVTHLKNVILKKDYLQEILDCECLSTSLMYSTLDEHLFLCQSKETKISNRSSHIAKGSVIGAMTV